MASAKVRSNADYCFDLDAKDVWPEVIERFLICLMIEEVRKGNRRTTTFTSSGWSSIKKGLKATFNKDYAEEQLKNKYGQLRLRHRAFKDLIGERGVHYNSVTGLVTASHEVWSNLPKAYKMRLRFRKQGCPEFPKLCILFGDATTLEARSPTHTPAPTTPVPTKSLLNGTNDVPSKSTNDEDQNKGTNVEAGSHESEEGRKNEASSHRKDVDCIMECVRIMDDLEIEGSAFGRALQALHDSSLYRELFLRMSNKRRREWALSLK